MSLVKKEMIGIFQLDKLGYDMMGYTFNRFDELSYHHLKRSKSKGGAKTVDNGAILTHVTSHEYLHLIERIDPDLYRAIKEVLIEENQSRRIEIANLRRIRDILLQFEREHGNDVAKKGTNFYLIKDEYIEKRIKL